MVDSLEDGEIKILSLRTWIVDLTDKTICFHHKQTYLARYSHFQKKCCDPFAKHKKPLKSGLREITLDASTDAQLLGISLVPGQKLCPTCHTELTKQTKDHCEQTAQRPDIEENDDGDIEFDFARDRTRESLDSSLSDMDVL